MRIPLVAYHVGDHISILKIIHDLDCLVLKSEYSFALFETNNEGFVYVKDYGSVVFINCNELEIKRTMELLTGEQIGVNDYPIEEYEILVDQREEVEVEFGVVYIPEVSVDNIHVIALNIAQSVALDDFQFQVADLLEITGVFSKQLDNKGKLQLSRNKLRKIVGQTMVLKNRIAENLFVFDTPDVAWSEPGLNEMDRLLRKELEIQRRHQGLQMNLSVVKENLDLYKDILQHRHSSTLEWIIIGLILFEVIQVIITK
jgi:uncharacterized Rmd1/YagE family protein